MTENVYTFTGKITNVGEIKEVGKNNLKTLEFVVEDDTQKYPQSLNFTILEKYIEKNQPMLEVGKTVTVSYNVLAREYDGRYFNSINCWKVTSADGTTTGNTAPASASGDEEVPF